MLFDDLLIYKNKNLPRGVVSICSANSYVLTASLQFAKRIDSGVLIEATSNQVDQFGGYTGLTPKDFVEYVKGIADKVNFPYEKIIFGGDHLGPNVWQNEPAESAMKKAEEQIRAYVSAGFRKIHLDTSFLLADDDKTKRLVPSVITERAAQLCRVAEETYYGLNDNSEKPVYVIGTEVPIPGGSQEEEKSISVTKPEDLEETIELSKKAFYDNGLEKAWERVIAVVVQPGVEFSDAHVFNYCRENVSKIKDKIEAYPSLLLEAHSTDYQTEEALTQMVKDHFTILKVGPWLTYAFREAIFALNMIEDELVNIENRSNLRSTIDKIMSENPEYWKRYYHGSRREIASARVFSYSDRIRYYWNYKEIQDSLEKMFFNLKSLKIPETIIAQYFPIQYRELRESKINSKPESLIFSKITEVLSIYFSATQGKVIG